MKTLTFEVKLKTNNNADEDELATLFEQYLTLPESPFLSDYGPDAWGGWDGPFVRGVKVKRLT